MAKTQKDVYLRNRIESLTKQLYDKPDNEVIDAIAGICGISLRTASEHFRAVKAQKKLLDSGFKEECAHDWSTAFMTPGGLVSECRLCGKKKEIK